MLFHLFAFLPFQISAQRLLTLDSCRQMALRYNKQMGVAKVKQDVAMTGEMTLRGRVLPIGGLKEKTLAAYRAGVRTLIIPKENDKDLEEIPEYVRKHFRIVEAEEIQQVLKETLI